MLRDIKMNFGKRIISRTMTKDENKENKIKKVKFPLFISGLYVLEFSVPFPATNLHIFSMLPGQQ